MTDGKWRHNARNLTGQTFGALTAVRVSHSDGKRLHWVWRCQCGREVVKIGRDVTHKRMKHPNCGCMTKALQSKPKSHGMSKHPVYAVWRSMMDRCRLPSHQAWHNYGARGVRVCEQWHTFDVFWADVGPGYAPGLTLDRIDNDGNYEPANVRWVDCFTQANNRRGNRRIATPQGEMTVAEASRAYGIGQTTLLYRLARGWPPEKLLIPADVRNRCTTS